GRLVKRKRAQDARPSAGLAETSGRPGFVLFHPALREACDTSDEPSPQQENARERRRGFGWRFMKRPGYCASMMRRIPPRLALLTLAHFAVDAYSSFLSPLLPLLIGRLGLSLARVGLLTAIGSASSSLSQPLFG